MSTTCWLLLCFVSLIFDSPSTANANPSSQNQLNHTASWATWQFSGMILQNGEAESSSSGIAFISNKYWINNYPWKIEYDFTINELAAPTVGNLGVIIYFYQENQSPVKQHIGITLEQWSNGIEAQLFRNTSWSDGIHPNTTEKSWEFSIESGTTYTLRIEFREADVGLLENSYGINGVYNRSWKFIRDSDIYKDFGYYIGIQNNHVHITAKSLYVSGIPEFDANSTYFPLDIPTIPTMTPTESTTNPISQPTSNEVFNQSQWVNKTTTNKTTTPVVTIYDHDVETTMNSETITTQSGYHPTIEVNDGVDGDVNEGLDVTWLIISCIGGLCVCLSIMLVGLCIYLKRSTKDLHKPNLATVVSNSKIEKQMIEEGGQDMNIVVSDTLGNQMIPAYDGQIELWLHTMKLAQYLHNFIDNGYDTMEIVRTIKDQKELIEIGITIQSHREIIYNAIKCRKSEHIMNENQVNILHCVETKAENNSNEKFNRHDVENWLMDIVGLPQYLPNFMDNGYDGMTMIQEIHSKKDLYDIGIIVDDDQNELLMHIEQIKRNDTSNGNTLRTKQIGHNHNDSMIVRGEDSTSDHSVNGCAIATSSTTQTRPMRYGD